MEIQPVGPVPPENMVIIPPGEPAYYNINTTATWSGNIQLRLSYDDSGLEPGQEENLELFRYIEDQSQWLGFTTSVDIVNNIVVGETDHLSVFAIMFTSGGMVGSTVVTNCNDSGPGSLRDAILAANSNAGADEIIFNLDPNIAGYDADIGVWTIEPLSALPAINDDSLAIIGFTQTEYGGDTNPNGPEVRINGVNTSEYASGIKVQASDVLIFGLIINGFGQGIDIRQASNVQISGCYIGINADGSTAGGNATGIYIGKGCTNVHVVPLDTIRNVISGNKYDGISISDSSCMNLVIGNIIGLDRTESYAVGNMNCGICITIASNHNEIIENHISGNKIGLLISRSNENIVVHNRIGTNESFELEVGNTTEGVYIVDGAQQNHIAENIIGHNSGNGIYVLGPQTLYNRLEHNLISRNGQYGIMTSNGGNGELQPPVLTSVTTNAVSGTAIPLAKVEIYSDPGYQGAVFEGEAEVDADGHFIWEGTRHGPYENVTAIAIDTSGNTSQFCNPVITKLLTSTESVVPDQFSLAQNYPNPFNPNTDIRFTVAAQQDRVTIRIVDMQGRLVRTLIDNNLAAGTYSIRWDGRNEAGAPVSSGVYLCSMRAGNFRAVRKLVLAK